MFFFNIARYLTATLIVVAVMPPAQAATKSAEPALLFVQTANGLSFNDGKLTLTDIAPTTIYFSDRPERMAGHIANAGFFRRWAKENESFKADPPNATLSAFRPDGGTPMVAVVTLKNPHVEGNNVSYDVNVLSGQIPKQSSQAALFIDGARFPGCEANHIYEGAPCWADKAFSHH
jgi:hypothetical protein